MSYRIRLNLSGFLCEGCHEPLSFVDVLLVAPRQGDDVSHLVAMPPKTSFAILSAEEVEALDGRVIGRGRTDDEGSALIEILEDNYSGGAFTLVLLISSVPHQKRELVREGIHVSLATVKPEWREGDGFLFADWQHRIPARLWCGIRLRFGAWVICGTVVDVASGVGVAGVIVEAFDTDVLQDDALGVSRPTDADGHFRIDYSAEDFQKTPFSPAINFEFFPGPDLYFRVSPVGGGVLLEEDRSVGRTPGRGNVRPCTCVTLRVPIQDVPQEPDPTTFPYWTAIGDFGLASHIDPATGRTLAPPAWTSHRANLAFTGNLRLNGIVPWRQPGDPAGRLKYRFQVQELAPSAPLQPVTGALLHGVQVGVRNVAWKLVGDTLSIEQAPIFLGATDVAPLEPVTSTPGPWGPLPSFQVKVDDEGWVEVSEYAIGGGFGVGGSIMGLATAAIAPALSVAAGNAGDPVAVADQRNGRFFRVLFEVARTDGTPLPAYGRELARLHISNHGEVSRLGIAELGAAGVGCTPLNATLTVQHTVDHEVLDLWEVAISSAAFPPYPASPAGLPTLLSGSSPRGGNGSTVVDISSWPPCSYTVSLTTRMALTDGINDDSGRTVTRTFCIDRT